MNKFAYMKMMYPQEMLKLAAEDEKSKKDKAKEAKKKPAEKEKESSSNKMYLEVDPRDVGRAEYNKHRFAGPLNLALLTAIGGLIGRARDQEAPARGTFKGMLGGAATYLGSHILGTLAGKIAGPRKALDEISYLNESTPSNYLIPGVAAFNKTRSKDTKRIFNDNVPFSMTSAIMGK